MVEEFPTRRSRVAGVFRRICATASNRKTPSKPRMIAIAIKALDRESLLSLNALLSAKDKLIASETNTPAIQFRKSEAARGKVVEDFVRS